MLLIILLIILGFAVQFLQLYVNHSGYTVQSCLQSFAPQCVCRCCRRSVSLFQFFPPCFPLYTNNATSSNLWLHAYILSYSMVQSPPEQLTGLQLVKKFPAFHGTQRFITTLTSLPHLSLSWASPFQSTCAHPTSWRSILISTHLRLGLPSGLFPSGFPTKTLTKLAFVVCVDQRYTSFGHWPYPNWSM